MAYKLPASSLRAVVLADSTFQPVYVWKDGKRTEEIATDEKGRSLYRLTNVPAVFQGQSDVVTLQTFHEATVPAGSIVSVDGKGESYAELRGTSDAGSRFVEQKLTVTAEAFVQVTNIADALK